MSRVDCIEHGKPEDKDGYARTSLGGRSLARRFKVAPNAVRSVVLGETWKHI